jgi:excinuclease UvrABC helicase subunit UvrB
MEWRTDESPEKEGKIQRELQRLERILNSLGEGEDKIQEELRRQELILRHYANPKIDRMQQRLQRETGLQLMRIASFSADFGNSFGKKKYRQSKELKEFKGLFNKLQSAVVEEDYLKAARIRDKMYDLRKKL